MCWQFAYLHVENLGLLMRNVQSAPHPWLNPEWLCSDNAIMSSCIK
jgi:hypothetical protein